jgi:hypothetical protein
MPQSPMNTKRSAYGRSTPRTLMCGMHWQDRDSARHSGGKPRFTSGASRKACTRALSMSSPSMHTVT